VTEGRCFEELSSATTGSATRVSEHQWQGQRQVQGREQRRRQRTAPVPEAATVPGHGHRPPVAVTDKAIAEHWLLPKTSPSPQTPTHAPHNQPVRPDAKPCENRTMAQRVLVHISRSEQRVVDPDDVYCLVATGGETEVRLRGRTPLIDMRPLGEVLTGARSAVP
jgi:hypothetical protein